MNTYEDQTKLKEHMLRCFEQEVCNISYMHPNQKINFNDWYMKIDPPMWLAAAFECMNVPVDDKQVDLNADPMSHAGSTNKKL